ncbi:putative aspartic peptidase domain superfamily [Helianthus annuus]|nr:putative aspartic peptidase domain superfamily [Helianthus annuus]
MSASATPPTATSTTSPTSSSPPVPTSSSATTPLLPTPTKPLPFHKLTPEQIQQRRKEGLCFRCPARYFPGHSCSPPQFLLIVDHGDSDPPDHEPPSDSSVVDTPTFMSLSPAAFFGMSSPQTLRLQGFILGKPVTVLVDCGSTHNIMQPRIATALSLPTHPLPPFPVMVGNGQLLHCEGHCPSVPVKLHNAHFDIPFFLFQIQGADIVLCVTWLGSLGSITADFSIPELSFTINGTPTTLRGSPLTQPVTPGSLSSLLRHDSIDSMHTLVMDSSPSVHTSVPSTSDPQLTALLNSFPHLFDTPHSLPPSRPHDHHIPLQPDNNLLMFAHIATLIFRNKS